MISSEVRWGESQNNNENQNQTETITIYNEYEYEIEYSQVSSKHTRSPDSTRLPLNKNVVPNNVSYDTHE